MNFAEVDHVLGKAGRADTPTDPAPLSMLETVIVLKPPSEWRDAHTWYSSWAPRWLLPGLRHITPDHISQQKLVAELNQALRIPGLSNSWTMPIRGRIDLLNTGIRTPVGLKIQGSDLNKIQEIGKQAEKLLSVVSGTRNVFAERIGDGYFLDVNWDRQALARYGLSIEEAQDALSTAVGGKRQHSDQSQGAVPCQRPLSARLPVEPGIARPRVGVRQWRQTNPIVRAGHIRTLTGASMIRDEDGLLTECVFVELTDVPVGDYVEQAQRELQNKLKIPAGYSVLWSGQYETRSEERRVGK